MCARTEDSWITPAAADGDPAPDDWLPDDWLDEELRMAQPVEKATRRAPMMSFTAPS